MFVCDELWTVLYMICAIQINLPCLTQSKSCNSTTVVPQHCCPAYPRCAAVGPPFLMSSGWQRLGDKGSGTSSSTLLHSHMNSWHPALWWHSQWCRCPHQSTHCHKSEKVQMKWRQYEPGVFTFRPCCRHCSDDLVQRQNSWSFLRSKDEDLHFFRYHGTMFLIDSYIYIIIKPF